MKNKKVMFTAQVDEALKKSFVKCCEENDTTASREVRTLMKKYVKQYGQQSLI